MLNSGNCITILHKNWGKLSTACPYAYETIYSEVVSGNWSIGLRRISPKMNNMNNVADFYSIRSGFAFFVISVEF
jgi:hypothetical protein